MRPPKPVVKTMLSGVMAHYQSITEAAAANGYTPAKISLLIKSGRRSADGSTYAHPAVEQEPAEPAEEITNLAEPVTPPPPHCPARIVTVSDGSTVWTCGHIEGGHFYCQQIDPESCRIYRHAKAALREGK